jgi:hypothetical protein
MPKDMQYIRDMWKIYYYSTLKGRGTTNTSAVDKGITLESNMLTILTRMITKRITQVVTLMEDQTAKQ